MRRAKSKLLLMLAIPLAGCAGLAVWVSRLPGQERVIAAFSTGLRGRTQGQAHNVRLALASLDGTVILPGQEFSFNQAVGPWTADRGYRKAPVSYAGEMVLDWGGGVCQASSTFYNAALLAGLPVLERHRHHWPARYVPPGQDAAVAYPNIDLRVRNALPAPIRISAAIAGQSVLIRLHSRARPPRVALERELLGVTQPATVVQPASPAARRVAARGEPGCQVALYRVFLADPARRELISRDTYPARNRVLWQ